MRIEEIREEFPITKTNKLYLNHAAKSPFNKIMEKELKRFVEKRQVSSIEYFPELLQDKVELKQMLADYIHGNEKNISFVPNTVEGLNILVDSLHWEKGDEVIVFEKDFPSNVYPFLKLEKFGVEIEVVKADNYLFTTEDYLKRITPKTKLLTVSYVNFLTGQVADLKVLGNACKLNNTLFCVDSIQGVGAKEIDVEYNHIDFISNGGHKWMMFPTGAGFIYFSDKLKDLFSDGKEGWLDRNVAFDLFNWDNPRPKDGRRFEIGSSSDMLYAVATASMKWRVKIGHDFIHDRVLNLSRYTAQTLSNLGFELLRSNNLNFDSGIISFKHKNAEALYNYLHQKEVTLALRDGIIRVSPHFYNTQGDIDYLIETIKAFC